MPGAISPFATFTHRAYCPEAQYAHGGSMPRTTQPRAGSTTTRSPAEKPPLSSTTSPTISCPITNGGEVKGEKYGELSAERVPRSEPQMPQSSGFTRTQWGVGRAGSRISSSCSGENRLVSRPVNRFAPARIRRYRGTLFLYWRARTSGVRCAVLFAPVLYLPAALFGRRAQAGVGVDDHRVTDGLKHREVGDRVRVSVGA